MGEVDQGRWHQCKRIAVPSASRSKLVHPLTAQIGCPLSGRSGHGPWCGSDCHGRELPTAVLGRIEILQRSRPCKAVLFFRSEAQEGPSTASRCRTIKVCPKTFWLSCGTLSMRQTVEHREEPVSDTREHSYSYIDWIIWAVVVIAIIGIGGLIVSNLPLLSDSQTHH
jgi:hypothetical protein